VTVKIKNLPPISFKCQHCKAESDGDAADFKPRGTMPPSFFVRCGFCGAQVVAYPDALVALVASDLSLNEPTAFAQHVAGFPRNKPPQPTMLVALHDLEKRSAQHGPEGPSHCKSIYVNGDREAEAVVKKVEKEMPHVVRIVVDNGRREWRRDAANQPFEEWAVLTLEEWGCLSSAIDDDEPPAEARFPKHVYDALVARGLMKHRVGKLPDGDDAEFWLTTPDGMKAIKRFAVRP
jgi:hypothetical protein